MSALLNLGVRDLGATELGALHKLLADGTLNDTDDTVYSVSGHTKYFGLGRPGLRSALRALDDAGYIHLGFVTGEKEERKTTTVRLLAPAEVDAKVRAAFDSMGV